MFARKRRERLPLSLLVIGIIVVLFAFIPPLRLLNEDAPQFKRSILPTLPPTSTPLPRPTDIHGGHIIFTCTRGDVNQLCMINADGTGFKRLTNHNANDYYPVFSPQGDSIVYASYREGSFDLYMLIISNSKLFQITEKIGNAYSPSFSPDGQQIAFLNQAGEGPASLWVVQSNGTNPRLLFAGPNTIVAAAWSPLGNAIAFAMAVETDFSYQIFLLDPDYPENPPGIITQAMSDIGGSLDWSPDGKYLLIYAGPVKGRNIYQLDVDSGEVVQLTFGGNNAAASYSPDGQFIVYNSTRNNDQADLYIMRSDGHSTRRLTSDPEPDWQPHWAP